MELNWESSIPAERSFLIFCLIVMFYFFFFFFKYMKLFSTLFFLFVNLEFFLNS